MDSLAALKQLLVKIPQQPIATACSYALLSVCCYQAAQITWQLWPTNIAQQTAWRPVIGRVAPQTDNMELTSIRQLNLFGVPQAKATTPTVITKTIDAPKTSLRLTLAGVVASSEPSQALAIIEYQGSQDTYAINEDISSSRAKLKQVLPDRVLIEYQGNLETLMLDGEEFTRETQVMAPNANANRSSNTDLSALRNDLLTNPAKITDYVRISPVRNGSKLLGYRVNPGKTRELFAEVGLEPNDLAVSLNGYDLTDTAQAMDVAKQLKDMTEMSLTVERDGQLHNVYLSLPE